MDLSSHSLYRKPNKEIFCFCAALVVPLQASKYKTKKIDNTLKSTYPKLMAVVSQQKQAQD